MGLKLDETTCKEICFEFVNREHTRRATMDCKPYWKKIVLRPNPHAILSYEIYGSRKHPDEHETVTALNSLCEEGKLQIIYSRDFYWYQLKE